MRKDGAISKIEISKQRSQKQEIQQLGSQGSTYKRTAQLFVFKFLCTHIEIPTQGFILRAHSHDTRLQKR